jgi:hypothetical protein
MAASVNDYWQKVAMGSATTMSSPGYTIGNTTINVSSTTNWPTATGVTFGVDTVDSSGLRVDGSYNVFRGTVDSATQLANVTYVGGDANQNYSAGSTTRVYILASSYQMNRLIDGLLIEHDQDGTHGAITASTVVTTGDVTVGDDLVVTGDITVGGDILGSPLSTGWFNLGDVPDTVTNNGNRSYDLVFNSNDLTDTVSEGQRLRLTRTVSAPTQCADLESGSSQAFTVTNATGLATGTTWTWKAKIKLESYVACIIGAIDDGTNVMQMSLNSSGQLFILGGTFAANDSVNSYQSVPLGRWVDVTASITIGTPTGEIRFDDVVVPSVVTASAATTMTISGDEEIYIGRNSAGGYFDGKICQVALFNSIVSDATLKTYSGQTMTGSESGCEGFWSLNGVLTDSSANANTLVAGGGALATSVDSPFGSYLGGTLEYGIITKTAFSTNTTLTVQVPEGCAIPTSGGVSAVSYSTQSVPYKFPRDKGRWRVSSEYRADLAQASPVSGTYYDIGARLTFPLGAWVEGYEGTAIVLNGTNSPNVTVSLSTSASALTDNRFTGKMSNGVSTANNNQLGYITRSHPVTETAATLKYLILASGTASATSIGFRGTSDNSTTIIYADLAYL